MILKEVALVLECSRPPVPPLQLLYLLQVLQESPNACLSNLLHFSNSSLFESIHTLPLHYDYCFLALLTSAPFSGPLPVLLCAPVTHRAVQLPFLLSAQIMNPRSVSLAFFVHTYMYVVTSLCFFGCGLFPDLHPHGCDPLTTGFLLPLCSPQRDSVRLIFLSHQPHPVSYGPCLLLY